MNTFLDLVKRRQSARKYSGEPVEEDKITRCAEAARLAPSACNGQPWHFIIVNENDTLKTLAESVKAQTLNMNNFVDDVPAMVVLVTEPTNFTARLGGIIKSKTYNLIDTGIAAEHFCLQATDEGLGTCIIGWFDEKKVKKILGIPKKKRAHLIISLGYVPDNNNLRDKKRKPLQNIISYNFYKYNRR